MTTFEAENEHIDAMIGKAMKFKSLIIDLRGNGGGYVDAMLRLVGNLFDHDVKVGDEKGRKATKPITSKTRGGNVFKGRLVVLIDSDSGSASEVFARVIQLEKRGTVIGDRSSGAVMTAKHYEHQTGVSQVLYYGTSVTFADLILSDGQSLEKVGVMPDEMLIPTGADLAAHRDPLISRAAELLGVELSPEKAGTFFPKEWRP